MRILKIVIMSILVVLLLPIHALAAGALDDTDCMLRDGYDYCFTSVFTFNGVDYTDALWISPAFDHDYQLLGYVTRSDTGLFQVYFSYYDVDGAKVNSALKYHYEHIVNGNFAGHFTSSRTYEINMQVGYSHYDLSGISVPVFACLDDLQAYLLTGDTTGQINQLIVDDPPIDAHYKDTYYYRNFKLANFVMDQTVHASWSGISYPDTYTADMISAVGAQKVVVSMGYCLRDYPTQVAYTKYYPYTYDVSAGSLDIPVANLQPASADEYLFYVQITPVIWLGGQYLHGSKNTVYFTWDGTLDKISTDSGNVNHTTITAPLPNNTWPSSGGSSDSSVIDGFNTAVSTMQSMYDTISIGVLPLIKMCFSFLPSWLTGAICAAVIICMALAIYHGVRG